MKNVHQQRSDKKQNEIKENKSNTFLNGAENSDVIFLLILTASGFYFHRQRHSLSFNSHVAGFPRFLSVPTVLGVELFSEL